MTSLGRIIRQRREEMNLTLEEIANRTGFSKPYLSTIETGKVKNPPSDKLLAKLERVLKFEKGFLQHMAHVGRMPKELRHQYESAAVENERLRSVIRKLAEEGSSKRKIHKLLNEADLEMARGVSGFRVGQLVPVINRVSAGYPFDFDDMGYPVGYADDYVGCPDLHDPNAFAVRVVGDSMEPRYAEGDVIVFSPQAEVMSGDDCFVRFSQPHEATFKRVFFEDKDQVRLQPRNEKYAPTVIDGKRINGLYKAVMKYELL